MERIENHGDVSSNLDRLPQKTSEEQKSAGWKLKLEEIEFAGCLVNANTSSSSFGEGTLSW